MASSQLHVAVQALGVAVMSVIVTPVDVYCKQLVRIVTLLTVKFWFKITHALEGSAVPLVRRSISPKIPPLFVR
jgi:hypothetical protein